MQSDIVNEKQMHSMKMKAQLDLLEITKNFVAGLPTQEIVVFKNKLSELCYAELQSRSSQ